MENKDASSADFWKLHKLKEKKKNMQGGRYPWQNKWMVLCIFSIFGVINALKVEKSAQRVKNLCMSKNKIRIEDNCFKTLSKRLEN